MNLEKEFTEYYDKCYQLDWADEKFYKNFLAQSYFYIRHSTKTLALAASHLSFEDNKLFKRMVKHIAEEMNHEMLCTKDLKNLGHGIDEFQEFPETQSLYQAQYYKIQHQNPKSYLGYIYVLESSCVNILPRILKDKLNDKFDKLALTFLSVHADEDVDHIESAKKVISELSGSDLESVEDNMKFTMKSYLNFLRACQE